MIFCFYLRQLSTFLLSKKLQLSVDHYEAGARAKKWLIYVSLHKS